MHSKRSTVKALAAERGALLLLALNFFGAVIYVIAASHGWVTSQDREYGVPVTGEPFVWAVYVVPIWTLFLLLNLIWGAVVLARHRWRSGILWLMTIPIWMVAMVIDFAHH
jgi:hypothetical protein